MKPLEAFLAHAKQGGMKDEAVPLATNMFKMLAEVRNATVDECVVLFNRWAEIAQVSDRSDVRLLVQTMQGMKEDLE